jgi:D-amino-acid dehydrogenase
MQVAVLGAGVIGLTTAWALVERGHDVTIVDRQPFAGLETSFGNGAQLSYAYVAPLASASILAKLPSLLLSRDGPICIRPSLDPAFIRWGIDFLRACNAGTERQTTLAQLALAHLSRLEMERLRQALSLDFGLTQSGKLVVFRSKASFATARQGAETLRRAGVEQEIASPERCLEIEPALRMAPDALAGGIFTPSEEAGDCAAFCSALAAVLARHPNVTWRMNTVIQAPVVEHGKLKAIVTNTGDIAADAFVLSLAIGSASFARAAGFHLPIQPMKGYSLTIAPAAGARTLTRSVTDFDNKTVFAPLRSAAASMIRVAGIADFVGTDLSLDVRRLDVVRRLARTTLDLDTSGDDRPWAGLRPATPDSRPIIERSPIHNLIVNSGHGGLGWTLACGSARLCAEIVDNAEATLPLEAFAIER